MSAASPAPPGPPAGLATDWRWPSGRLRWRWRVFAGIWLVYAIPALSDLARRHQGGLRLLGIVLFAAFCLTYIELPPRARTGDSWLRWGTPLLLGLLAVAITPLVGPDGVGLVVYVAVATAVLQPPKVTLAVAAAGALLSAVVPALVPSWRTGYQWLTAGQVLLATLAAIGFGVLIRRNSQLQEARAEVARLAAEQERLRIARDMHDLLGHSLTTITVKAELARRLVTRDSDRASAELADVERLARQSLADVRAAVAGYREVTLASELATAREVLAAAGITAELPQAVDDVPAELRELFGWVVREGVTNAVRHSRAHWLLVSIDERAVEVVDDGLPAEPAGSGRPGSGLVGLAERAARLGGTVDAGPLDGRGFRLRVEVPERSLGVPADQPDRGAPVSPP